MISIALSTFSTAINGDLICDDSMKMLEVNNVVTDSREFKLQQTASD